MDLREIGISMRSCVDSAQDRNDWRALCIYGIEPQGSRTNGVSSVSNVGLWSRDNVFALRSKVRVFKSG